ncbi:hypothetical protein D3C83_21530 [compost metagenome]
MRNGGVGQHALQVRLRDRRDVADRERQHRHYHQHLLPFDQKLLGAEALNQQTHDERERGKLGR